jgi:hypothetical protein
VLGWVYPVPPGLTGLMGLISHCYPRSRQPIGSMSHSAANRQARERGAGW